MTIFYHITDKSTNVKTGPMPVISSSRNTCPNACPFKNSGCYGDGGPIRIHWDKISKGDKRALTLGELIEIIPDIAQKAKERGINRVRLWQVGDMPGSGNYINKKQICRLVRALKNFDIPFGYTHKPIDVGNNKELIKFCNDSGIVTNLSANNLNHADYLSELNIGPVSVTLPSNYSKHIVTPNGRRVVVCPAVISENITCSVCGGWKGPLCGRIHRDYIVGFPAHGFRARKASEVARESKIKY